MTMKGKHHTEETKSKMRLSHKGGRWSEKRIEQYKNGIIKPSMKDRHHSNKAKRKMSLSHKGKHVSVPTEFKKGHKSFHTLQSRYNLSVAIMGHEVTKETRTKISNSLKNRNLILRGSINYKNFKKYREQVKHITNNFREVLFKNWNGYCFYTGEYIVDKGKNFPTIDHKVSIYCGFVNKISPKIIGNKINLVICSRIINSKKHDKVYYDGSITVQKLTNGFWQSKMLEPLGRVKE